MVAVLHPSARMFMEDAQILWERLTRLNEVVEYGMNRFKMGCAEKTTKAMGIWREFVDCAAGSRPPARRPSVPISATASILRTSSGRVRSEEYEEYEEHGRSFDRHPLPSSPELPSGAQGFHVLEARSGRLTVQTLTLTQSLQVSIGRP
jgi:hypothetical protein